MTTSRSNSPSTARRMVALTALAAVVTAGTVLAVTGSLARSDAAPSPTLSTSPSPTSAAIVPGPDAEVQTLLDGIGKAGPYPGLHAAVQDREGAAHHYTTGVGDLTTGAPMPVDGSVRVASNTKTYTATLVLQLVDEGKVALDEPIETYLPGLVQGTGAGKSIDGAAITVRQILQHTSGLPEYLALVLDLEADPMAVSAGRYFRPVPMLLAALAQKPSFAPGDGWSYSNTNYLIAGLLVEEITGRPFAEELEKRIIEPLGLQHTSFPAEGDMTLPEPHPLGYQSDESGTLVDVTELDPSVAWAAGQLIATPSDVNLFFTALLDGKLLSPETLAEMQKTVPTEGLWDGLRYGLGLMSTELSCGGLTWGHGGDMDGYHTSNGATADGRAVTVAATHLPSEMPQIEAFLAVVDAALCD